MTSLQPLIKEEQMKKYRLLKELPDANIGTIITKDGDYYVYNGIVDQSKIAAKNVENNTTWFSLINSHPTKEEIIEEVLQKANEGFDKAMFGLISQELTRRCMDKYAESIKEQLIEKVADAPPEPKCVEIEAMACYNAKKKIINIIKDFKAE